jgi:ABC-2 family transporter protein
VQKCTQWDLETITPDEAFGYLSEILGGNQRNKDGFISFRAKDIILDMGTLAIDLRNVYVTTGHGTHLEVDKEFSFRFALDELEKLVPNNTTLLQFRFNIPSKTNLMHNSSSPHAVAAYNQAYMEHRYKQCLGDVRGNARLTSINHPLPLTAKQSLEIKIMLSVLAGLFILIPFCYIPATFIVSLVRERVSKSKHLQLVSGVNMSAYWISTYLWDLTLYFFLSCCIMLVFLAYGSNAQVFIGDKDSCLCTFGLVFGYGFSSLPFAYLLSRKFNNSSTAQISVAGIGWLTGFVTVISYVTMINVEKTYETAKALQPWFRLFPAYNVGEGFMFMSWAFWYR